MVRERIDLHRDEIDLDWQLAKQKNAWNPSYPLE